MVCVFTINVFNRKIKKQNKNCYKMRRQEYKTFQFLYVRIYTT